MNNERPSATTAPKPTAPVQDVDHGTAPAPSRQRRSVLSWLLPLLFVLGFTWWLFGEKTILWGRSLVAGHYARKAQEKIQAKDWQAAARQLAQARAILVNDPAVLRAYADFLIGTGSDNLSLLQVLRLLDAQGLMKAEERVHVVKVLTSLGRTDDARSEYEKLSEAERAMPASMEVLAHIYRAEGRHDEADILLRRALQNSPDDPDTRLKLAILDHENTFSEVQQRAHREMWQLAARPDDVGLRALEQLILKGQVTGEEAAQLQERVAAHPHAAPWLRYAALSARLRARPQDREAMIQAEVERIRGQGVEQLTPALTWLLQEKQSELVLKLLPEEMALKSGPLLHTYLLALSEAGRWQEVGALLNSQRVLPVTQTFVHAWKARVANQQDKGVQVVRHHLEAAFSNTNGGQEEASARMTAEIAEQMGQWDLAAKFYNEIATLHPLSRGPMLEKVYEAGLRNRNTETVLKAAGQLSELYPDNRIHLHRHLYLQLLAGANLETVSLAVDALPHHADEPMQPVLRALAAYRLGNAVRLREALANLPKNVEPPTGPRGVLAGLLAAAGQVSSGFQIAENIPGVLLLPEEVRFLTKAL